MTLNVKNTTTGNVSIFNFTTFGDMMQHVRLFANKPHFDANVIIDGKVTHRGAAEILNLNNWF
tara:strand:- start:203 stop:391 length:189 start_codon:yes stop_codon:yes gene_type:complete